MRVTEKGSVLIAVLWSLFFLSALAAAIYAQLAPQIALAGRLKDRARLYYLSKAGVEKAMVVIAEDDTENYDAFNDVWASNEESFKDLQLGEQGYASVYHQTQDGSEESVQKRYGLIDEERKININKASVDVLRRFFEIAGETTSQTAADIADSIVDWIDEDDDPHDNGAESGYYEGLEGAYSSKNKEFQMLEELLLIKGMTPEIFDKVRPFLTVYGQGKINLNTAQKYVLESLGISDILADKVIQFRAGNDNQEGTEDDGVFESIATASATLESGAGLTAEEAVEFNTVVAGGLLDVISEYFYGESYGTWQYSDEEEPGPTMKTTFVMDRGKNIKYWHEQ